MISFSLSNIKKFIRTEKTSISKKNSKIEESAKQKLKGERRKRNFSEIVIYLDLQSLQ